MTLLLSLALGTEFELGAQTGNTVSGAWTKAAVSTDGLVHLEAYGQIGSRQTALYLLTADGGRQAVDWTLGRQRVALPSAPRVLDGARVAWQGPAMDVQAWAGRGSALARQDGVALVRGEVGLHPTGADLKAGVWSEHWSGSSAVHGDLQAVWPGPAASLHSLLAVGSMGDATRTERARLEVRAHPAAGVDVGLHVEHRDPLQSSPLAPDVLPLFAPEGRQELGAVLGMRSARRSRMLLTGSYRSWEEATGRARGGAASLELQPSSSACSPSWKVVGGPMGTLVSMQGRCEVPVPEPAAFDALALRLDGGVAPYQTGTAPWDTAAWASATVSADLNRLGVRAGATLAHTPIAPVDPRLWLILRWEG
jgi:hypothetical protein